jgi:hypothetical protein
MWECQGTSNGDLGKVACIRYLMGIADGIRMADYISKRQTICIPAQGISGDQVRLVFIKYATDNPAELHESARVSALLAFLKAFPCK